jgi:hypothetical protein
MSIELHCPKCQKLIRAPDNAGGRRGKCPYCKNSVYIPMPPDEVGEIPLAPIDAEEERRAEELRRESIEYVAEVDHATGPAGDADEPGPPPGDGEFDDDFVDVPAAVEAFIWAMSDSKLDEAEEAATILKKLRTEASDYVQGLLVDELPPAYGDVPPPVVKGFLKTLLGRLS